MTAEKLLWADADSCLSYLNCIDLSLMTKHDSCVCILLREHAALKVYSGLDTDSLLHTLKDYFEAEGDYRYAGEACYVIGRYLQDQQVLPLSMFYYKAAEELLTLAHSVPDQLAGAVYYGMGSCAEYERLFEIAIGYYRKALPYFIESNDSLYISCTYRDIAKLSTGSVEEDILILDSADNYLPQNAWLGYQLDLEINRKHFFFKEDPSQYIPLYQTLCDSLGVYQYSAILFQYYLDKTMLDSASYYLCISELDTANSTWSKESYLYNKACYQEALGSKDSAIAVLKNLHLWQTSEIEASAHTRAYMVEQRYDAERERADRIKAEADKHRAHLIIIIVCISALLLVSFLLIVLQRERMKKRQKEEHNRMLMEQLRLKQEHLQKQLKLRLNISSELKKQKSSGKKLTEASYNQLLSSVVFLNPCHWNNLMQEFDVAYAGLLTQLSNSYSLSDVDRLYVVLIVLGCSTSEISELANVTLQSVSNRKQRLKQHVKANGNIEEWLNEAVKTNMRNLAFN